MQIQSASEYKDLINMHLFMIVDTKFIIKCIYAIQHSVTWIKKNNILSAYKIMKMNK